MDDLEDTQEIMYTSWDLLTRGEPKDPVQNDPWVMPKEDLLDVIRRIQIHAYDGDYVFKLCREVLGHE